MKFRGALFLVVLFFAIPTAASSELSDAQVRQQVMQESTTSYRGSCPCLYSVARNGTNAADEALIVSRAERLRFATRRT